LLIDSDASANKRVADRINKAIAQHPIFVQHGVSCSAGATTFTQSDDAKSLFERADKALYEAKHAGKNMFIAA
jgi:PleD family two-component response regulator